MIDEGKTTVDHAGVRIPPPLIYIAFLIAGAAFDSKWVKGDFSDTSGMLVGGVVFAIAGFIAAKSVPRHKKEGSNVEPWKPTTKIISDGLYALSRNPIYLAMAIAYAGVAIAAGSTVALVFLFPCLLLVRYYVIAREERYLGQKFGAEYQAYKDRVRRWI